MEDAIARGEVAWHALPFSFFTESMDAPLFRHGLGLSQKLDRRFGKQTIAAKMTDVPGHTRGIVPLLAEAGVRFLHIGVNAACTPPDVPPLFTWQDAASATAISVMYQGNYGDVMVVPGLRDALAFAHTDDNVGPQSVDQVVDVFRDLRARFPGADVRASTMDAFAAHLPEIVGALPVVTAEIGDTWIYGVASDPQKEAQFRALLRLRGELERGGASAAELDGFSDQLLLLPEHTHGLDVKTHLNDWTNYGATPSGPTGTRRTSGRWRRPGRSSGITSRPRWMPCRSITRESAGDGSPSSRRPAPTRASTSPSATSRDPSRRDRSPSPSTRRPDPSCA